MNFSFSVLTEVDNNDWDEQLLKNEVSTFFQTFEYVTTEENHKLPLFIYIYDKNENVVGQLALNIISVQPTYSSKKLQSFTNLISKIGNRASWVSGPIIFNEKYRLEVLQIIFNALSSIVKKYNLMLLDGYTSVTDNIDNNYLEVCKKNGYNVEKFITFRIDLNQDIDIIWKNVSKNGRNDVTKAERLGIEISEITKKNQLVEFFELARKWATTKGIDLCYTEKTIETDWKDLKEKIQHFFLATQNGIIVSGLRVGTFNGIAHTHQVLNSYSKAGSIGGPALTWYAIKWAKTNGFRIYDFSGVKLPSSNHADKEYLEKWEGLVKYKRKWGGKENQYYHLIKVSNSIKYKAFRLFSRPDLLLRERKRKAFKRPKMMKGF